MKEIFEIRDRFTHAVRVKARIECPAVVSDGYKLGLAVAWAAAEGIALDGANLTGLHAPGLNLPRVDLAQADLSRSYLPEGCFSGGCLKGALFSGACLSGAYLDEADLSGADLTNADLAGAHLLDANMSGAILSEADFAGADLANVDVSGATLAGKVLTRFGGMAQRSDGYMFLIFGVVGGELIRAECRTCTLAEYRAHVATEYPGTPKAVETLRILQFLEFQLHQPSWR